MLLPFSQFQVFSIMLYADFSRCFLDVHCLTILYSTLFFYNLIISYCNLYRYLTAFNLNNVGSMFLSFGFSYCHLYGIMLSFLFEG